MASENEDNSLQGKLAPNFDRLIVVEKNNKKLLGTGGYATVRLVRDPKSQLLFALKEVTDVDSD